jgi:hypothetical protein
LARHETLVTKIAANKTINSFQSYLPTIGVDFTTALCGWLRSAVTLNQCYDFRNIFAEKLDKKLSILNKIQSDRAEKGS